LLSERNFTPTSTAGPPPISAKVGTALLLQIEHGQTEGGAANTVSGALLLMLFNEAEIVELPTLTPVAKPPLLIVAAAAFEELHATCVVMFWVLPS
jgi:hypothetical protein